MLSSDDKEYYLAKVLNPNLGYLASKALRKQILGKAKKTTICQNCGDINGTVKKASLLKIVHEKYKNKKKFDPIVQQKLTTVYNNVIENNKELKSLLQNGLTFILNPIMVRF